MQLNVVAVVSLPAMTKSDAWAAIWTFEDINSTAALQLKYLHALALEAMRIYPPLPLALPFLIY
jgi:hypothetical protein